MATAVAKPGYREFTATKVDGSKIKLSVRLPGQRELQAADMEASGAFNRALEAALPTRQRMIRRLRQNGLWSDADAETFEQAREGLGKAERTIRENKFENEEEKKAAQDALRAAQSEIGNLRSDFEAMLAHTADARADEARRNFLITCTVEHAEDDVNGKYKKGQRLWSGGVAEFLNDPDTTLGQRAIYEYLCCENDMPSEWTENELAAAQAEAKAKAEAEEAQRKIDLAAAASAAAQEIADQVTLTEAPPEVAPVVAAEPVAPAAPVDPAPAA